MLESRVLPCSSAGSLWDGVPGAKAVPPQRPGGPQRAAVQQRDREDRRLWPDEGAAFTHGPLHHGGRPQDPVSMVTRPGRRFSRLYESLL